MNKEKPHQGVGLAQIVDRNERIGNSFGRTIERADPAENKDRLRVECCHRDCHVLKVDVSAS